MVQTVRQEHSVCRIQCSQPQSALSIRIQAHAPSSKALQDDLVLQIEIEKPLGLKLGESKSPGGGLKVTGVSGNAAKSGLKVGDTVIYTSSFFGDELWPADKLGFSRSAIGACPSPVCLVYVGVPPRVSRLSTFSCLSHTQKPAAHLSSTCY